MSKGIVNEIERTRMLCMMCDPEFRESEKQRALNEIMSFVMNNANTDKAENSEVYRTYLWAIFAEKEAERVMQYNDAVDTFSKLKSGVSPAMADLFSNKPLSADSQSLFNDLLDNFNSNEIIQDYDKISPLKFREQIENAPEVLEMIATASVRKDDKSIKLRIDEEILSTLTQEGRNSKEYNDIAKAIADVNSGAYRADGNVKDVEKLYNALKTYTQTHDSRPFHDYGKARFNQSAILMGQIGMALAEQNPEMAEQINKDINILMLRNKPFRDQFIKAQQDRLSTILRGKTLTQDLFRSFDPKVQAEINTISARITFGTTAGKMLEQKTKYGQVTGKLSPANQEKLLNHYSGILKYAQGRTPEMLSYKSEIDSINNAFADNTSSDISVQLQENVAKIILKNKYIEKAMKGPTDFDQAEEINNIFDTMNDPAKLNQFAGSEDFRIFFNSLGKHGIEAMVNNPKNIGEMVKAYDSIVKLDPQKKAGVKLMNMSKAYDDHSDKFSLFFKNVSDADKSMLSSGGKAKGLEYSIGRTALQSLAVSAMLADKYSMDDILDPYKLIAEREKYSKIILNKLHNSTNQEFIEYAQDMYRTGMQKSLEYFDNMFDGEKDLTISTISQDKFAKATIAANVLNDMGQEYERYATPEQRNEIIGKQSGVANVVKDALANKMELITIAFGNNGKNPAGKVNKIMMWAVREKLLSDNFKESGIGSGKKMSEVYTRNNKILSEISMITSMVTEEKYVKNLNVKFNDKHETAQIFAQKSLDDELFISEDFVFETTGNFKMFKEIQNYDKVLSGLEPSKDKNFNNVQDYMKHRQRVDSIIQDDMNKKRIKSLEEKFKTDSYKATVLGDKARFIETLAIGVYIQRIIQLNLSPNDMKNMLKDQAVKDATEDIGRKISQNTGEMSIGQISNIVSEGKIEELIKDSGEKKLDSDAKIQPESVKGLVY